MLQFHCIREAKTNGSAARAGTHEEGEVALAVASPTIVIHERLGFWSRHLRPRLHAWPVRWVETRATADLEAALLGLAFPVVVIDLGRRVRAALEDLDRAVRLAPNALILVVDPEAHAEVATLARELGATHVFSGPVTPPEAAHMIARWLPLAQRHAESNGWSNSREAAPEPEPWNWLAPLLAAGPAAATPAVRRLHEHPTRVLRP